MMRDIPAGGRRQRIRAATVEEIKATARRILADHGAQGVTLRAIARYMGMTAPALYRYFPSHEDLWRELSHDTYGAIAEAIEQTLAELPEQDAALRLLVAARRFRSWAVEHPGDFGLLFGLPLPGVKELADPDNIGGMRFALVFTGVYVQVWEQRPFPILAEEDMPARLRADLASYRDAVGMALESAAQLPLGAVLKFLQAWVQLYGVVTMEVFGHLGFCLGDVEQFFEIQLAAVGATLGIDRPPTG